MKRRRVLLASLGLAVAAVTATGCDQGNAFVAENKTDQELIARVTGKEVGSTESGTSIEWRQDVTTVPAHSRLAILVQPFTTNFTVWTVEILSAECSVLATFDQDSDSSWATDGILFVVEPDASVRQVREFPREGEPAHPTDRCHDLPDEEP